MRLFTALAGTWVGLTVLALLVIGLSVASIANRPLQFLLDTTETGVYGAWPLVMLWLALCVNIALATLLRVPFRLDHLGAHLAHVGVLVLAIGAMRYAHAHVRGDVQVPRLPDGFPAVDFFYDAQHRALLVAGDEFAEEAIQNPLPELPLHRAADKLSIPINAADPALQVRVTAYRPQAIVEHQWREGGGLDYPAARVSLSLGEQRLSNTLVPEVPVWDLPPQFRVEYRPDATPADLADLRTAGGAMHTLTIEGPGGFRRTEAVAPGDALDLAPLGYRVIVLSPQAVRMHLPPDAPAPAKGELYLAFMPAGGPATQPATEPAGQTTQAADESATQPASAPVRPAFLRRVVAKADDHAWDLPLGGQSTAPVGTLIEPDITVRYAHRDESALGLADDRETLLLLSGPEIEPTLLWFDPRGPWAQYRVEPGESIELYQLPEGLGPMTFTVEQLYRQAQLVGELAESLSQMHLPQLTQAVQVELTRGEWTTRQWLPLEWQPHLAKLHQVSTPGGVVNLQFARLRRTLGARLHVHSLEYAAYPGTNMPRDYICRLTVQPDGGESREAVVRLNEPLMVGDVRISQSGWDTQDPRNPSFTVLGVASRPGIGLIWVGCIMIALSMPYAFYVKPLLGRRAARRTGGAA